MYVVLAASGHIGSQVVQILKSTGQDVLAVTHDADKALSITGGDVEGVVVDLKDADALRGVLRRGKRHSCLFHKRPRRPIRIPRS